MKYKQRTDSFPTHSSIFDLSSDSQTLMRNPNLNVHHPWRILLKSSYLLLLLLYSSIHVSGIEIKRSIEWQLLTKTNFSSEIHLHHHVLLFVTVPWSGECRSLMKKVSDEISYKLEKLDDLKLMVLYKNKEKMLADALGVTDETTIFFYYHAVSYKYQGRLRAQNIFSSVDYFLSSQPAEFPLKLLNTAEDLNVFFQSTDKAVLLFEFCGWTSKLLDKGENNGSEYDIHIGDASYSGVISGANFYGKTNPNLKYSRAKNEKEVNNDKLTCDTVSGLDGIPWMSRFITANQSAPSESGNTSPGVGLACTSDDFQRFESFFSKFTTFAREFFLPPERQRFGLVSERQMLSSLGVNDPDPWLVMIHFAGCSNCSKIVKEGDDLRTAFNTHHFLVTELKFEGQDIESALPRHKPSIVLFVDRSSESLDTRRKSKEALEMLRYLAINNQHSYGMSVHDSVTLRELSDHAFQGTKVGSSSNPSKHSRRESSQLTRLDNFKNKMSVMIINEDGNVRLDANAQDRSIQDILINLLRQKNKEKLSSVAKEVGFQLLSGDLEVKLAELLQPQAEKSKLDKVLSDVSTGNNVESDIKLGKENMLDDANSIPLELEERTRVADFEPSQITEQKITYILKSAQITSSGLDDLVANGALDAAQELVEGRHSTPADKLGVQQPHHGDLLEFYFSDGCHHLLNSLTSKSEVPSMIIIDPVSEQHFVYPQEEPFSYSSLQAFLDAFLNRSLIPYQRSESLIASRRETTKPPFINLDFHEVDSIPRVTPHTFSEMVLGFNHSENKNIGYSWNKDVLVLFSNHWCGFCQRMELVVGEVFRSIMRHLNTLKSGYDITRDAVLSELPLIFSMDCTLNDCTALLKSMGQRDVYPALLLFPAQRKTAISYQGDVSVNNVLKFLNYHGRNFLHLDQEEDVVWTAEDGDKDSIENASSSVIGFADDSVAQEAYEVILHNRIPTGSNKLITPNDFDASHNVVVGSVLIATDKLLNAPPFDKSMILIVQTNQSLGFQGLIINKRISWESVKGLNEGFELVKQAPLSFGGPLIANGMPLLSLTRRVMEESYSEVLPGVYFLNRSETVQEIETLTLGNQSTDDYWFFLGYSSWGWEQLFAEIADGAWRISADPLTEFDWPGS